MAILDVLVAAIVLFFAYLILRPIIKNHFAERRKEADRKANAEAIAMNHAYEAMKAGSSQRIEVCLRLYQDDLPLAMNELLRERLQELSLSEDFDRRVKR